MTDEHIKKLKQLIKYYEVESRYNRKPIVRLSIGMEEIEAIKELLGEEDAKTKEKQ